MCLVVTLEIPAHSESVLSQPLNACERLGGLIELEIWEELLPVKKISYAAWLRAVLPVEWQVLAAQQG